MSEMETYYEFTKKVMQFIGINFNQQSKYKKLFEVLKYFSLFVATISSFQSFLFFCLNDESIGYLSIVSLSMGLYGVQGTIKFFYVVAHQKTVAKLMHDLSFLYLELNENERKKSLILLLRVQNICFYVFKMLLTCLTLFNSLPFVTMLISYAFKGQITFDLVFGLWWPFDQTNCLALIYLYQVYFSVLLTIIPNIMDHLFFLILSVIITQFERLGEEIKNIINKSGGKSYTETNKNLREIVAKQNVLMSHFDILNGIYGIPFLAHILSSSMCIGLVGLIIIDQPLVYSIPCIYAMFISLAQIFLPCWFGNKIKEKVITGSRNYFENISNFHLEPSNF